MAPRITNEKIAESLIALGNTVTALAAKVELQSAQHSTPTAVAEAVTPVAETPSATDTLLQHVVSQGLAFARGGRSYLSKEHLTAAVRVLKTGTPEVLPYSDGSKLSKRGVTHIALGRGEDGTVITQFVFTPTA